MRRRPSGKYSAQIKDSKSKGKVRRWLGTFDTARAFDAAAVRLRGAPAATNFKQTPTPLSDDEGVAPHRPSARAKKKAAAAAQMEARTVPRAVSRTSTDDDVDFALPRPSSRVKKKAAGRLDSGTEFCGVHQRAGGRYGARIRIRHSKRGVRMWLGTFDTAEDAAKAYDAAAVKMYGASAVTNFETCGQPASKTSLKQPPPTAVAADYGKESHMDLLNDLLELSVLDFRSDNLIPGAQHDDLKVDLTPVE